MSWGIQTVGRPYLPLEKRTIYDTSNCSEASNQPGHIKANPSQTECEGSEVKKLVPSSQPKKQFEVTFEQTVLRPGPAIARHLPDEYQRQFQCVSGADGIRSIVPTSFSTFVLDASFVGHAISLAGQPVENETSFGDHAIWLVYQRELLRIPLGISQTVDGKLVHGRVETGVENGPTVVVSEGC